jgi:hypothetical protein
MRAARWDEQGIAGPLKYPMALHSTSVIKLLSHLRVQIKLL